MGKKCKILLEISVEKCFKIVTGKKKTGLLGLKMKELKCLVRISSRLITYDNKGPWKCWGKGQITSPTLDAYTVLGLKIKVKYNIKCLFSLNQCISFPVDWWARCKDSVSAYMSQSGTPKFINIRS